ncbi:Shedu anti-phage system protein SduA domain-containing protein [Thermodesulfobacteriota bacterium]
MSLPPENSLEDVKIRIKETYTNPNVAKTHQVVLKEGPRIFKIATLLEIVDGKTGKFHHYSLKIDHIDRQKKGWFAKPEKSMRLEGKEPNEIEPLYRFLDALLKDKLANKIGELHIIGNGEYVKLEKLLDILPDLPSSDKLEVVKTILSQIDDSASYVDEFIEVFQNSNTETLKHIAIASRFVEYKKAYEQMRTLIEDENVSEPQLQKHLEKHPWMFGSEYSKLLDRRTWTRDDTQDFMLRRTADNFLEVIEIKTPFKDPILRYDQSHDSYYPSAKLSSVIGQVMRYIAEIERDRDSILTKDKQDTLKIRARIIIGRDASKEHQEALRNLNSHLNRIEVLTFDQLLKIADRVLSVFEEQSDQVSDDHNPLDDDSIPF